ncbi:MAG: NAD(P)H-dependent oxidoreductase [Planctomycetes bacterium]|nr:NAD(P)H-dependent oxidoreductase [Planctomycetota bacterium]
MAKVIVLFDSRGGNTRAVAESIVEGASMVPDVEAVMMSAEQLDMEALAAAQAVAVGSPNYYTYMSGRIKTFFDLAFRNPAFKGKPFVAFSTHGGGGGISQIIEKLAGSIGMAKVAGGIDIMNAPAGDQLKECRKLGQMLGRAAANA